MKVAISILAISTALILGGGCASSSQKGHGKNLRQSKLEAGSDSEEYQGSIDREAVRKVIRSRLFDIKNCYEEESKIDPNLQGKIVVEFEIADTGIVKLAKIKSSTMSSGDPALSTANCTLAALKGAQFPAPAQ